MEPQARPQRFINAPNLVSALRIVMIPVLWWSLSANLAVVSFAALVIAVTSDLLDGIIARATRQSSPLGTLIDHSADAAFVTAIAGSGAMLGLVPWPLPILITLAFLQYAHGSQVFRGAPLRASQLGRWNGVAYYFAAAGVVAVHHFFATTLLADALYFFAWLLIVTTLLSMLLRWQNRQQAARTI